MHCFDVQVEVVLLDQCFKLLNGCKPPCPKVFFFDVHVDMEHPSSGFQGEQASLPHRF